MKEASYSFSDMIVCAIIFNTIKFVSKGMIALYFALLASGIVRTSNTASPAPFLTADIILFATIGCPSVVLEPITIMNSAL